MNLSRSSALLATTTNSLCLTMSDASDSPSDDDSNSLPDVEEIEISEIGMRGTQKATKFSPFAMFPLPPCAGLRDLIETVAARRREAAYTTQQVRFLAIGRTSVCSPYMQASDGH